MQSVFKDQPVSRFLIRKETFGGLLFDRLACRLYHLTPGALELLVNLINVPRKDVLSFLRDLQVDNFASYMGVVNKLDQMGISEIDETTFDFVDFDSIRLNGALISPLRVFMNLNNNCNCSCRHCFVRSSKDSASLPREKAFALCSEMADIGVIEVSISGGEPFLYPHLFDFLDFAAGLNLGLTIATNGYFINQETTNRLLSLRKQLHYVNVSIDGPEDVNDYIRGKGSFMHALNALKLLTEVGIEASAHVTITKPLIGREKDLVKSLYETGINRLVISEVRPTGRAVDHPDLLLQLDKIQEVRQNIDDYAAGIKMAVLSEKDDNGMSTIWDYLPVGTCGAGWNVMSITADGNVYPCTFMIDYFNRQGIHPDNVFENTLIDIWHNGSQFKNVREQHMEIQGAQCPAFIS